MTQPLFRPAALERLSTPERLDSGLAVIGGMGWTLLWSLVGIIVVGLAWSVLLRVPVTVSGEGILLSPGGIYDVSSGSGGRITALLVKTGSDVTAGQLVAEVAQPQLLDDVRSAESELLNLKYEDNRLHEFQTRRHQTQALSATQRRRATEENLTFLRKRLGWMTERQGQQEELAAKGYTPKDKLLQAKIDVGTLQDEIARAESTLKEIADEELHEKIDDEQQVMAVEIKISAAERRLDSAKERLAGESQILSPYAGHVEEIKVNVGEMLERGTPLFTLVPDDAKSKAAIAKTRGAVAGELVAILYVPANSGKQIRQGAPVNVALSTARREEFGFVMGRVASVADIPSTNEGMQHHLKNRQLVQMMSNNGAPFEVVVELFTDPNTYSGYRWSSSKGPQLKINDGTLVTADIEVRSVPLLGLLIPPLRHFLSPDEPQTKPDPDSDAS